VLGIRIAKYLEIREKPLATEFVLAWKHDYSNEVQTSSRFVGSNSGFSTKGLDLLRDSMRAGIGVEADVSTNTKLFIKYDTEFNGQFQSHTGQIGIKMSF
jgi:outer membrane autotransporter protein